MSLLYIKNVNHLFRVVCVLVTLFFMSCEKENSLKELELSPNAYEDFALDFITVENIRQVNCNSIRIDIVIQEELIPDSIRVNLSEYRPRITDALGKEFLAERYKGQLLDAFCKKEGTYYVTLYHYKTKNETKPHIFTFTTK